MKTFWPLSRNLPFSRVSVVEMLWEFVPASGSVIANATFVVPAAIGRTNFSFCSSVPCLAMIEPTIAGDTTISSRGVPLAASSSPTAKRPDMPSPPPPTPRAG